MLSLEGPETLGRVMCRLLRLESRPIALELAVVASIGEEVRNSPSKPEST
jgi:hypothetical protein